MSWKGKEKEEKHPPKRNQSEWSEWVSVYKERKKRKKDEELNKTHPTKSEFIQTPKTERNEIMQCNATILNNSTEWVLFRLSLPNRVSGNMKIWS